MKNPWRFFIVIESLLAILLLWQLSSNPAILLMLLFGILMIYWAQRKGRIAKFRMVLGVVIVGICLINSPATWLMLIFAVLFVGLKGVEIAGVSILGQTHRSNKKMIIVKTKEPLKHDGKKEKQSWIGNERIGTHVFEWDDINLAILAGDTIIDLGNTLLPKEDSLILVRKGIGRTRILVPYGVGILFEHTTAYGQVRFDGETQVLKNETIKMYSDDYSESSRRLKIVTSTLLGDIEVIRV